MSLLGQPTVWTEVIRVVPNTQSSISCVWRGLLSCSPNRVSGTSERECPQQPAAPGLSALAVFTIRCVCSGSGINAFAAFACAFGPA